MKIKMLKSTPGSQNGFSVDYFKKGEVYEVVDDLAKVFIEQMKVAKKVVLEPLTEEAKKIAPVKEEKPKMEKPVYENKAVRGKSK